MLGYTNSKRNGWLFEYDMAKKLVAIQAVTLDEEVEKVRKLANRFHAHAWDDLKAKLLADPKEYFANYGYTVTSITSKFPDDVLVKIRYAFENKANYRYRQESRFQPPTHIWGGTSNRAGRTLSVECKLCEDGIFRAWFSSEFSGCANGDYWMLANPTTAIFKERD